MPRPKAARSPPRTPPSNSAAPITTNRVYFGMRRPQTVIMSDNPNPEVWLASEADPGAAPPRWITPLTMVILFIFRDDRGFNGLINRFSRFFDGRNALVLTQLIKSGSLGDQIVVFIRVCG